jgi:hypothetical protein
MLTTSFLLCWVIELSSVKKKKKNHSGSLFGVWWGLSSASGPGSAHHALSVQKLHILHPASLTAGWRWPGAECFVGSCFVRAFWTVVSHEVLDTIYVTMSALFFFFNNTLSEISNYFVTAWLNLVIKAVIKSLPFQKKNAKPYSKNTKKELRAWLKWQSAYLASVRTYQSTYLSYHHI